MIASAPLRLTLDGDALVSNWRWLADRSGAGSCGAAIKADGYGLGAAGVAARLAAAGARDFFVATWAEAEALGALPDGAALGVLHGVRPEDMGIALASPARPVLNTPEQVVRWKATGSRPCDVMVDTGMNRLGLTIAEATGGLLDGLKIDTLHSHLACADEPGHPINERQRQAFAGLCESVAADRYSLANSAGIMLGRAYAHDLVRPGLALYGGRPVDGMAAIRQVAVLSAQVLQCRRVHTGETVGYGATFTAPDEREIGILNVGYADGYFRAFAGTGFALAGQHRCPLLGRVSMDLIAVDITGGGVSTGDWLTVDHDLPAAAEATGLSQYELLTSMGHRFERRWL